MAMPRATHCQPSGRRAAIRAEQLAGAAVIDEYVDKDSATRVDQRPAMLAMIERVVKERDVDFVIVHQLSRFTRNRLDDAMVTAKIEEAGTPWFHAWKVLTRRLPDA